MSLHGTYRAAVLACGSLLLSCTEGPQGTAPVHMPPDAAGKTKDSAVAQSRQAGGSPKKRYIVIQRGQSVGAIAQIYHVPKQAIVAANHLYPPYKLKTGARLEIPQVEPQSGRQEPALATPAASSARSAEAIQPDAVLRHPTPDPNGVSPARPNAVLASGPTLTEAFAYAYNNNPQLLAQRALLRSTDEQVPQALSNWRPTVTFTGQGGFTRAGVSVPRSPAIFSSFPTRSMDLRVTQPLYRGGRTRDDRGFRP